MTERIVLNQVPIEWDLAAGNFTFFGIPAVLFWLNPSMYRMLRPLVDVCGVELYQLLVAYESSRGTDEDYHAMVTQLGSTFAEGFLAWGAAVSTAGWGHFELPECDHATKTARVKVVNPWELKLVQGTEDRWGCPFIQGKIIGVFSYAFGVNCWADAEEVVVSEDELSVVFRVYPADKTIATEIERVRKLRHRAGEQQFRARLDEATASLREQLEVVERQRETILRLSAPLIQVWDGILVLPLIGELDEVRIHDLIERTLAAVTNRGATHLILDLTGVDTFSVITGTGLLRLVGASRLLGTHCMFTGISPELAQGLVEAETSMLANVPTYATVQAALESLMAQLRG